MNTDLLVVKMATELYFNEDISLERFRNIDFLLTESQIIDKYQSRISNDETDHFLNENENENETEKWMEILTEDSIDLPVDIYTAHDNKQFIVWLWSELYSGHELLKHSYSEEETND